MKRLQVKHWRSVSILNLSSTISSGDGIDLINPKPQMIPGD